MTTTGESRTRIGNRLFDRFVGVRRPSFPQPRRLNTAKQNSRHRQSGRASTRIFRSACLSFLQLPRKSTEARAERPPTSSDFCEIYSIWGMSNGVPEAYDPRGHLMKHENKATEYMVETRAGRLNFAIATVIGLLTLASGLLGPALLPRSPQRGKHQPRSELSSIRHRLRIRKACQHGHNPDRVRNLSRLKQLVPRIPMGQVSA